MSGNSKINYNLSDSDEDNEDAMAHLEQMKDLSIVEYNKNSPPPKCQPTPSIEL